jgi:Leucine-rich repeat (LRR) protein
MRFPIAVILFIFLSCSRHNLNITELDLSNQNLLVIPDSVFSLTYLEYLQLGNSFTMYPPLSALGRDNGSGDNLNKINELPNDIDRLRDLRVLGLSYNNLRSLPEEIVKLERLDTLDLSFNKHLSIATASATLRNMPWVKYLNIIATNADTATVDKLRKALPKTTIVAKPEDLETVQTFQ